MMTIDLLGLAPAPHALGLGADVVGLQGRLA